jgi:hypothetical protein
MSDCDDDDSPIPPPPRRWCPARARSCTPTRSTTIAVLNPAEPVLPARDRDGGGRAQAMLARRQGRR